MFSNNNNNPEAELFLAKEDARDDQKEEEPFSSCVSDIKLEPISRITSSSPKKKDPEQDAKLGCQDDDSVDEQSLLQEDQERVALLIKIIGGTTTTPSHCDDIIDILLKPSPGEGSSGGDKKEEDDGFRTPELKIPPQCKICPPAPRKGKQSERNKRKASSSNTNASRRILVFDELDDMESLFTAIKRSRRREGTDSE